MPCVATWNPLVEDVVHYTGYRDAVSWGGGVRGDSAWSADPAARGDSLDSGVLLAITEVDMQSYARVATAHHGARRAVRATMS